jgi:hypothetical protein
MDEAMTCVYIKKLLVLLACKDPYLECETGTIRVEEAINIILGMIAV